MSHGKKYGFRAEGGGFSTAKFTPESVKEYYAAAEAISDQYYKTLYEAEKHYDKLKQDLYAGMLKAKEQAKLSLKLKEGE